MNLTQDQLLSILFTVGFGLAFLLGKVLEVIFKEKELDLDFYNFITGVMALIGLYGIYTSFGGN